MKNYLLLIQLIYAAKLKGNGPTLLFTDSSAKLNQFQKENNQIFVLGMDRLYGIDSSGSYKPFELSSKESIRCTRSGLGDCHNYVQNMFVLDAGQELFACGTDSGTQTCYSLDSNEVSFHAPALVGLGPKVKVVTSKEIYLHGEPAIISAGPALHRDEGMSIQMARLDTENLRVTKIRGTNSKFFTDPVHVLALVNSDTKNFVIGRRWDNIRKSWVGFLAATCLNDPGHIASSRTFVSTTQREIACCVDAVCYENLAKAIIIPSSNHVIALYHDERNSTSTLCRFSTADLEMAFEGDVQYLSQGRLIKNEYLNDAPLNLANCAIYKNITEDISSHQKVSFYSNEFNGFQISTPAEHDSILLRNYQITEMAIEAINEGFMLALFAYNKAEKFSIVGDKFYWNIELEGYLGDSIVSSALLAGNAYLLYANGNVKSLNLTDCSYYNYEATCLTANDLTCGWSDLHKSCIGINSDVPDLVTSKEQITIEQTTAYVAPGKTITMLADTSGVTFDSLVWYKGDHEVKLTQSETLDYSYSFKRKTNRAQLILYRREYSLGENQFVLDFNIRNQTVKRQIFIIREPIVGGKQVRSEVTLTLQPTTAITPISAGVGVAFKGLPTSLLVVLFTLIVVLFFIVVIILGYGMARRKGSSISKQASILESDHSFHYVASSGTFGHRSCLLTNDSHTINSHRDRCRSPAGDLYMEKAVNKTQDMYTQLLTPHASDHMAGKLLKTAHSRSACDGESFKSDYMSCSSSKLSSNSDSDHFLPSSNDDAIIVFPDGTMGKLKAHRLKELKDHLNDIKPESEEEKMITGTLKRKLKRKL